MTSREHLVSIYSDCKADSQKENYLFPAPPKPHPQNALTRCFCAPTRAMNLREILITLAIIASVAVTRFVPHPPNFTPVMSVAIFGSAVFFNRYLGLVVALAAMALSDLFLGMHSTLPYVYGAMILCGMLGFLLRDRRNAVKILGVTLVGSVVFFVITNLGVFISQDLYPKTGAGLVACYVAALPYLKTSLVGDILFSAVLFGLHHVLVAQAQRREFAKAV